MAGIWRSRFRLPAAYQREPLPFPHLSEQISHAASHFPLQPL